MLEAVSQQTDHELGRRLTALTIGMDRLERSISKGGGALSTEGLVPIYMGEALIEAEQLSGWQDVFGRLDDLQREVETYPHGSRRSFLVSMIDSLRAAAELFDGQHLSFSDKLERLVGVPAGAVPEEQVEAMRTGLLAQLEKAGYRQGNLEERAGRWEAERALDPNQLEPLFINLMAEAKQRTDERIFPTGDYDMQLNFVRDISYSARCRFDDRLMDLNADLTFTRPALKHLVAHEVFPGHATQLLYTYERAKEGHSPADVLLCTANAATGAVQEGIGDQGIHLIDWVDSDDDAIYLNLRRLRSAAATSAAWYLMGANWPEARVRQYLQETAFPQQAWLDGRVRFASHPFRGAFIASYWFGDEAVRMVRERTSQQDFPEFVEKLYGNLNTPQSLQMDN